jgi:hypothetical protein
MHTTDDQPPSSEPPSPSLKETIAKLDNKYELQEYAMQLSSFNAYHLSNIADDLKERLMLQGLDENDLRNIHEYLGITFDGELVKYTDKKFTEERAHNLSAFLNI